MGECFPESSKSHRNGGTVGKMIAWSVGSSSSSSHRTPRACKERRVPRTRVAKGLQRVAMGGRFRCGGPRRRGLVGWVLVWGWVCEAAWAEGKGNGNGNAGRRSEGVGQLFGLMDEDRDGEVRLTEIEAYVRRTMGDGSEFDTDVEVEAAAREVVEALDFGGDGAGGPGSVSVGELGSRLSGFMDAEGVAEWVAHGLRLPQYAAAFLDAGVEAEDFPLLLDPDAGALLLENDLGVGSALHRAKITRAMRKLVLGIGGRPEVEGGGARMGRVACTEMKTCGEVALGWVEAAKREDSGQVSYRVQRRKAALEGESRWEDVGSSTGSAFVDVPDARLGAPGQVPEGSSPPVFEYRVQAWNHVGGGGWSEVAACPVASGPGCVPAARDEEGEGAAAGGAELAERATSQTTVSRVGGLFAALKYVASIFSTLTAGMQLITSLLVLAVTLNVVPRQRVASVLRVRGQGWDPSLIPAEVEEDAKGAKSSPGRSADPAASDPQPPSPLSRTRSRESLLLRDENSGELSSSTAERQSLGRRSPETPGGGGEKVSGRTRWLKAKSMVAEQVKQKKVKKTCQVCNKLLSGGMWYERHYCRYCQSWMCTGCTHHAAHSWFSSCDGDSKCVCVDKACIARHNRTLNGPSRVPTFRHEGAAGDAPSQPSPLVRQRSGQTTQSPVGVPMG